MFRRCRVSAADGLFRTDGTVTAGNIVLEECDVRNLQTTQFPMRVYSAAAASIRVNIGSGCRLQSGALWVSLGAGAICSVYSDGSNTYEGDVIASTGSPAGDAGSVKLYGSDIKQTLSVTLCGRPANGMAISTAASGTLTAGLLAICDATGAAGSWKQMTDTTKNY